ncbi:hypothetical protein G7081_00685 [Vagococcus coleopterorum]|uniref:PepSY domain-containing protein n=1 Tax=Vagococcus coleopterorum TaxID=2714946 RepID=A0A6G8ALA0_9ENTE|nr:PepSY domain-containing protein [Vagococcus coleopterorum]QIL45705.1 hypothetical protein G7081_00685 [Vagococcus coleopterorum]
MAKELKKYGFVLGLGAIIGSLAGVSLMKKSQEVFDAKTTNVLSEIKERFTEQQEIEGSWIQSDKEVIDRLGIETEVYKGGFTCKDGDTFTQYEFIADAKTGALIDIYPLEA